MTQSEEVEENINSIEDIKFYEDLEKVQTLIFEQFDPKRALKLLELLISQKPEEISLWINKGNAYYILKDKNEAEKAWLKCLELDPKCSEVYEKLAGLKKDKKQYFEALNFLEKAFQFGEEKDPYLLHLKGQLHCLLGDSPTGKIFLEEALKILEYERITCEDKAENSYRLACIHSLLGNSKKSLEYLQESVELDNLYIYSAKYNSDFHSLKYNRAFQILVNCV